MLKYIWRQNFLGNIVAMCSKNFLVTDFPVTLEYYAFFLTTPLQKSWCQPWIPFSLHILNDASMPTTMTTGKISQTLYLMICIWKEMVWKEFTSSYMSLVQEYIEFVSNSYVQDKQVFACTDKLKLKLAQQQIRQFHFCTHSSCNWGFELCNWSKLYQWRLSAEDSYHFNSECACWNHLCWHQSS